MFVVNMTFISSREVKKWILHSCLRHSWNIYFFTSLDETFSLSLSLTIQLPGIEDNVKEKIPQKEKQVDILKEISRKFSTLISAVNEIKDDIHGIKDQTIAKTIISTQDLEIIKTNILSKIHDGCFKNVTARVLTRFSAEMALWPSFDSKWPSFKLDLEIIKIKY